MQEEATGNQKTSLGCPVQGNRRTGCSTGSTGSGFGSTAATAERTGRNEGGKKVRFPSIKAENGQTAYCTLFDRTVII